MFVPLFSCSWLNLVPLKVFGRFSAEGLKTVHQLMSSRCEDSLKLELLRRWEYDIKALEVADDEGMTGSSEAALMQDIELAIQQLERV